MCGAVAYRCRSNDSHLGHAISVVQAADRTGRGPHRRGATGSHCRTAEGEAAEGETAEAGLPRRHRTERAATAPLPGCKDQESETPSR